MNRISAAEWRIMQVLWEAKEAIPSAEIVARMSDGRSPKTLKTLLQRLVSKKIVGFMVDKSDSRVYHYFPMVNEDECIRRENKDFLSLYYNGDVGGMLARFIGDSALSDEQIQSLSALLEAKKEDAI